MKTPESRRGFFLPTQHVGQPYAGNSPEQAVVLTPFVKQAAEGQAVPSPRKS